MPKAELLKLLAARGVDVETPKVQSELIENADLGTDDVCIPTWDEENILTKVRCIFAICSVQTCALWLL